MTTYFNTTTNRFFFILGETSDEFCKSNLEFANLHKILHNHLKKLDYKRIVFYEGTKGLHCHDQKSFDLAFNLKKTSEKDISSKFSKDKVFTGVLGARVIKKAISEEEQYKENSSCVLQKNMNDVDIVRHFDTLIKDKTVKTAVVFSNLDDFIKHTEQQVLRDFSSNIKSWDELSHDNENIIVFIAPKDMKIQKDENQNERFDSWAILNNKQKKENTIIVSQPYQDEIRNLINHYRILKDLEVDWLEFDENIKLLRKIVKEKSLSLKNLASKIRNMTQEKRVFTKIEIGKLFEHNIESVGLEKLRNLQGLDYLTDEIEKLVKYEKSKKIESQEICSSEVNRIIPQAKHSKTDVNLNIALIGNPGTGKTTVAQIISEVYKENGIFEVGHIIKAKADDLMGEYVGHTAVKTAEIIEKAIGGVLFIDEAYKLTKTDNPFGEEAVNSIVEAMTERAGEFAVIIAGYPNEIKQFLESNPGLNRRFANQIIMKDYEPDVLENIFRNKMKKDEYIFDEEMEELFPHFIKNWFEARDEKRFGNAGDVLNLFDNMAKNSVFDGRKILTKDDITDETLKQYLKIQTEDVMQEALSKLDDIVGLKSVKENIKNIIASIKVSKLRNPDSKVYAGHYVFKGNPGTGKTTVARIFGEILKELKVLPKGHFIETTREDLVQGYIGQTATKTKEILEKAKGGILFVDEAYSLSKGGENDFGKEAIDTIVPFMENNRENFTLIVAGYDEDMDKFLDANTGLKSRFNNTIIFEDYNEVELIEIFKTFSKEFNFDNSVEKRLKEIFETMKRNNKHFGNGRDVRKLFDVIRTNLDRRVVEINDLESNDKRLFEIKLEDLSNI
jgi:AAA+ superfamily predicted ATPase